MHRRMMVLNGSGSLLRNVVASVPGAGGRCISLFGRWYQLPLRMALQILGLLFVILCARNEAVAAILKV